MTHSDFNREAAEHQQALRATVATCEASFAQAQDEFRAVESRWDALAERREEYQVLACLYAFGRCGPQLHPLPRSRGYYPRGFRNCKCKPRSQRRNSGYESFQRGLGFSRLGHKKWN
jgi:hypothetical protein